MTMAATVDGELQADLTCREAVRHYCDAVFKGIYFLVLIAEATGYEEALVAFVAWLRDRVGAEAMQVLSQFHAEVTIEERTVNESLDLLFSRPPLDGLLRTVTELTGAELTDALSGLLNEWAEVDLGLIPAGDYSLSGLLLDRALALPVIKFELGWRLHRLL
jgi:hypothetical protein